MPDIDYLFVYGTLAPGQSNHRVIQHLQGCWEPATTRGRLLPKGWGATLGFPALIPKADGEVVSGLLFSSAQLMDALPMLDDFEGGGYRRERIPVVTAQGNPVSAWVYALNDESVP